MRDIFPLINLSKRRNYRQMSDSPAMFASIHRDRSWTISLICSYILDWFILAVVVAVGGVLSAVEPNKRPFSVLDPNISFPYTENETVPVWPTLAIAIGAVPIVLIFLVCLVLVPGNTVPKGLPKQLVWKRKLWELHAGWLGYALSMAAAWFITNGMKNMFGKPRPDLLSRCKPDLENIDKYIVGGTLSGITGMDGPVGFGQLVSASICTETDSYKLDDGFRSYPSGHASAAAASLVYLSLFLSSKLAVTLPFCASGSIASSHSAFPSRLGNSQGSASEQQHDEDGVAKHAKAVASIRRQAAAPPLYLLVLVIIPFFGSVFIAGSRWFDFRHHGFDILFGYLIGLVTSIFAFRYYHLPIRQGAGWAWGPRSHEKGWWSGVGSYSYATGKSDHMRPLNEP